jgi:hypothetical protein
LPAELQKKYYDYKIIDKSVKLANTTLLESFEGDNETDRDHNDRKASFSQYRNRPRYWWCSAMKQQSHRIYASNETAIWSYLLVRFPQ